MIHLSKQFIQELQEKTSKEFKVTITAIIIFALIACGWLWHPIIWRPAVTYQNTVPNQSINYVEGAANGGTVIPTKPSSPPAPQVKIMVYVTGAVKKPGVYSLSSGARCIDAIKLAGGILNNGDATRINLAKKLHDEEMLLILPKIPQLQSNNYGKQSYTDYYRPPMIISLNKATTEELQSLPGIGERLAKRIVLYRETNGSFSSVEDLKGVSGMRSKLFYQIKNKLTI